MHHYSILELAAEVFASCLYKIIIVGIEKIVGKNTNEDIRFLRFPKHKKLLLELQQRHYAFVLCFGLI